jgi:hypothetical protein
MIRQNKVVKKAFMASTAARKKDVFYLGQRLRRTCGELGLESGRKGNPGGRTVEVWWESLSGATWRNNTNDMMSNRNFVDTVFVAHDINI